MAPRTAERAVAPWRRVARAKALARVSLVALALAMPEWSAAASGQTPCHVDISQGFARLVFELSERPEAQSEIAYGVLVLRFKETIAPDLETLRIALGPYVSLVRQDNDGKTLRFALRGPVRVQQAAVGHQLAIDLLPPPFTGEPPVFNGLAAVAAGAAAKGETSTLIVPSEARDRRAVATFARPAPLPIVPVHVGEQPTFTRVVFDWPGPVDYVVEPRAGATVVRFSQAAQLDLSDLRSNPPRYVHDARVQLLDGKVSAVIELDPNVEVRDLRDGNKIVIDLSARAPAPVAADPKGAPKDDNAAITMGYERAPSAGKAAASPASAADSAHPLDDANAVLSGAVEKTLPPKAEPEAAAPAEAVAAPAPAPSPAAGVPAGVVSYLTKDADTLIVVPWSSETAGAVFRRGDTLWMVFDTDAPLDPGTVPREVMHDLGAVTLTQEDGARVLRAELKNDALIDVGAEGPRWVVRLTQTPPPPAAAVSIARELSPAGAARLRLTAGAAGLHWLKDPVLGDDILVGTAKLPERGVPGERQFVELDALGTAQGVALTPFSEDLRIYLDQGDILVEGNGGLDITASETIDRGSIHSPVERIDHPGFLDFAAWRPRGGDEAFIPARMRLMQALAAAPEKERAMKRFALARFYAANGFGEEASGVLDYMLREDPRIENAAAFHALRGAALFMRTHYKDAAAEFAHASLANDREIAPWRAAVASALGQYPAAAQAFQLAQSTIPRYPPDWQACFRLLETRTALARGDIKTASQALAAVPAEGLDAPRKAEADLLAGRVLEAQGKTADALAHYTFAAAAPRSAPQAEARFAAAALGAASGSLPARQAIDALEKLRFDWRGDTLELKTLSKLGEIYTGERRYRDGLTTMRAALSYFPDEAETRSISQTMGDIFRKLYLEGGADAMKPIEALALYYDFRELTPIGRDGDDMIRRLAERLVMVDLLPQAAELLQHQVDKRLKGAAKAQVATRLAMVYLMDHKPEDALRAIRTTRQVQLPDAVQEQRRLLEARALAELKQYDAALEVLLYDESKDAERVRADVYWRAGNWPATAEHIESLLGDRWRNAKPLEDEERFQVMRAALAYLFAKDDFGLTNLKDRYGVAMKASPDAPAFALVTEKPDTTSSDFGELARKIAAVDTLDAFMMSFRRNYADMPPPATN